MQILHAASSAALRPSVAPSAAFCRTLGNTLDFKLLLTVFYGAGESS